MKREVKRNLVVAFIAALCLGLSIFVFYPSSMDSQQEGGSMVILSAYFFYITQALSFMLTLFTIAKSLSMMKSSRHFLAYLPLLIGLLLAIVFMLEFYWLIRNIP